MKLDHSLISRRTFLNSLLGGWLAAFLGGSAFALIRFAFPTVGKEPDFVVLKQDDYLTIPNNSVKPFAWGGKLGLFFKNSHGHIAALKGVCTHMECNIAYRPEEKKFYCACHKGWFDEKGKNIEGPPPRPLEFFDVIMEEEKLIIARKGITLERPKA